MSFLQSLLGAIGLRRGIQKLVSDYLHPSNKTLINEESDNTQLATATSNPEQSDALMPFDPNLLERTRTQWQFGDWESLARLDQAALQHHPEGAKLALFAAAGLFQVGRDLDAKKYIQLALDRGVSKRVVGKLVAAGVYNSLGRAAAISNEQGRALQYFGNSITIGTPGSDANLLTPARTGEQLRQLGVPILVGHQKVGADEGAVRGYRPVSARKTAAKEPYINADFSSAEYWEDRYKKGGTAGYGSYGRLADFKAKIINRFIQDEGIESVIDLGCGDGNQLSMFRVERYVGVDVSSTIIEKCREKFKFDMAKTFYTSAEFKAVQSRVDLSLSLDTIFHLVEDRVYEDYMTTLLDTAKRYCIIYACDEEWLKTDAAHIRRRKFSEWIATNIRGWRLMQVTYNKYPHDGSRNPKDFSFSNFYFYERI